MTAVIVNRMTLPHVSPKTHSEHEPRVLLAALKQAMHLVY